MIRAAARGIIDFSKAEFFSPAWQIKLRLLLNELQAQDDYQSAYVQHQHLLALLQLPHPPEASDLVGDLARQAVDLMARMDRLLYPWRQEDREDPDRRMAKNMRNAWLQRWGDPQDPEVQAKIARVAEALKQQKRESTAKTPMDARLRLTERPR